MPSSVVGRVDAARPVAARVPAGQPAVVEPRHPARLLDRFEPAAARLARHGGELSIANRRLVPTILPWRAHDVTSNLSRRGASVVRLECPPEVPLGTAAARRRLGCDRVIGSTAARWPRARPASRCACAFRWLCNSTGRMEPLQIVAASMIIGVLVILAWGRQHTDPE
jgi:hypothetical protein